MQNRKALLLCSVLTLVPALRANFVGIYDYLDSLAGAYAAQTGAERWTFHTGDENGALMGLYGGVGYGNAGAYAQFSSPAAAGAGPGGTAGTNETAGIFTHTASSGFTSAVFHADSAFLADAIVFTHELVNNGNLGNGIDLGLRTVIGGSVVDHGTFSIFNTLSAQTVFNFGSGGLAFNPGDEIVVMFSARGSYLHDHGWWDISLQQASGNPGNTVPDAGATLALLATGLLGLVAARRRLTGAVRA